MVEYKNSEIHLVVNGNLVQYFASTEQFFLLIQWLLKRNCKLEQISVINKSESCVWGTLLVSVLTTNGSIRLCADYKTIVDKYIKDVYNRFHRIENLFTRIQEGEIFTKLDFWNAYNQLRADEKTRKLLAWSTLKGSYQVLRLPYSIKPATAIFQREVDRMFQDCPW